MYIYIYLFYAPGVVELVHPDIEYNGQLETPPEQTDTGVVDLDNVHTVQKLMVNRMF